MVNRLYLYHLYFFSLQSDLYRDTCRAFSSLLGKTDSALYAYPHHSPLNERECGVILLFWFLRTLGYPMAYILLEQDFWQSTFKVCPACLIPRPETEHLVEAVIETLPCTEKRAVAELGVGSGAVVLTLAQQCPSWSMTATDISASALCVAQLNAKSQHLYERIHWHQGDWLTGLGQFDAIVSNPPYVEDCTAYRLSSLCFEPGCALFAGTDGMAALQALIDASVGHLRQGGWLFLEHGADQGEAVRFRLRQRGFDDVQTRCDLAHKERVTLGRVNKK